MSSKRQRMIFLRTALLVVLAIILLFLSTGCNLSPQETGSAARTPESQSREQDVGKATADVPVADQENKTSIALPEGYPADLVPIMEGSSLTLSTKNEDQGNNVIYWVAFTSPKSVPEIRDYYLEVLSGAQNIQQVDMNEEFSISGSRNHNSFTISISSNEVDGKMQSIVSIMVGPEELIENKE